MEETGVPRKDPDRAGLCDKHVRHEALLANLILITAATAQMELLDALDEGRVTAWNPCASR